MAGRQGRRDARLQDTVPLDDAARLRVVPRLIERVRELANQAAYRIAGQFCVCIEGDDKTDIMWGDLALVQRLPWRGDYAAKLICPASHFCSKAMGLV